MVHRHPKLSTPPVLMPKGGGEGDGGGGSAGRDPQSWQSVPKEQSEWSDPSPPSSQSPSKAWLQVSVHDTKGPEGSRLGTGQKQFPLFPEHSQLMASSQKQFPLLPLHLQSCAAPQWQSPLFVHSKMDARLVFLQTPLLLQRTTPESGGGGEGDGGGGRKASTPWRSRSAHRCIGAGSMALEDFTMHGEPEASRTPVWDTRESDSAVTIVPAAAPVN